MAFVGLVMAFVLILAALIRIQRPNSLIFVLTGDTQGFLVPCGCPVTPAGGLARRATILAEERAQNPKTDVIPVEITRPFADRGPGRDLLNSEMAAFFRREGYGAIGLSGTDLLLGPEALKKLAGPHTFCLAGAKGYPASAEFRLGGWGIGPFGALGERLRLVFLCEGAPGMPPLPDPVQLLVEEQARNAAEGWIVLGSFSPATSERILKECPKVLAMVAHWKGITTAVPQNAKSSWVVYLGDRGRRICTLQVTRYTDSWSLLPEVKILGDGITSDIGTEKEVASVLEHVAVLNRQALQAMAKAPEKGGRYLGPDCCAPCHHNAHRTWLPSLHAKATEKLKVDHQEDNPACLVCHATALGKPGGYPQGDLDLSGVQCEACHGPGEGHPPRPMSVAPPSREACAGCHTERDSPSFDPEGFWQMIRH